MTEEIPHEIPQQDPSFVSAEEPSNVDTTIVTDEHLTPTILMERQQALMETADEVFDFERAITNEYPSDSTGDKKRARGVGLWLSGRYFKAIESLEEFKGDSLVAFLLADAYIKLDKIPQALGLLEKLVAQEPDMPLYLHFYADAMERTENYEKFSEAVQKYLSLVDEESDAVAHYLKGLLAEAEGDYDEAEQRYATAVVMDRHCDSASFRLAQHHYLRGNEDKAVELYEELTGRSPAPAAAMMNLGVIYEDREDFKRAENCYSAVLEYYPEHERAQMYFRDALASQGMYYDEERERKEDKKAQVLRIPVTDFELSVRSRNCLAKMNIRTLGDLTSKTEAELLAFKNFGETSLAEIKEILRQKGLRLGNSGESTGRPEVGTPSKANVDPNSILNKPLNELDLSVRSRKACDRLQARVIGDLTRMSEPELLACKNFGHTSLTEIKKKLLDLGLTLRQ